VVGAGTVGQWLLRALHSGRARRYDLDIRVVGIANAHDGFIYDERGLDIPRTLRLISERESIADQPGARRWPSALEGLRATEADVLVEATGSPATEAGEPGLSHIREALERSVPVVTANKWPVALHGVELALLAESRRTAFRAESTVMSGTPVVRALTDGLAGATPIALRGILNATANFILSRMNAGDSYEDALAEAQRAGLAERDPGADVDGQDSVAKVMILAALVFGRQLAPQEVVRRGITGITRDEIASAVSVGARVRHVATLAFAEPGGDGAVTARVEPMRLPGDDPLAHVEGTANSVACRVRPVGDVTITGPGAGLELAGQGVLSDLIDVARSRATT
jgi:homoserine dehydrogenase